MWILGWKGQGGTCRLGIGWFQNLQHTLGTRTVPSFRVSEPRKKVDGGLDFIGFSGKEMTRVSELGQDLTPRPFHFLAREAESTVSPTAPPISDHLMVRTCFLTPT